MAETKRPRRYYLHKRQTARDVLDKGLELVWRGKQEAEPGTALPANFPFLTRLSERGYTTEEDLDGADVCELEELEFTAGEASTILLALSEL